MVQKINPHPAPGCNRSPPYYVFSKDAILGSIPSISSEVLALEKTPSLTYVFTHVFYRNISTGYIGMKSKESQLFFLICTCYIHIVGVDCVIVDRGKYYVCIGWEPYSQVFLKLVPIMLPYYTIKRNYSHFHACAVKQSNSRQFFVPKKITLQSLSMTSLLTHDVAHSTRHSFRPKTNNQPFKKFLSLAFS